MTIFLGTALIMLLCCLAMGLGYLISGKALAGGCGSASSGAPRCAGCPKRRSSGEDRVEEGEGRC